MSWTWPALLIVMMPAPPTPEGAKWIMQGSAQTGVAHIAHVEIHRADIDELAVTGAQVRPVLDEASAGRPSSRSF